MKRRIARWGARVLSLGGALRATRAMRRRKKDFRVYILEYHGVDPNGREWEGTISQHRFRQHVRWLRRHYDLLTVAQAVDRLAAGGLGRDAAVITFDDGYANNVEGAFPVLRDLGAPATIYLATGFLDGRELWFDTARRALDAIAEVTDAGMLTTNPDIAGRLAEHLGHWPPSEGLESLVRRLKYLSADDRTAVVGDLKAVVSQAGIGLRKAARPMTWDQARELRDAGIELGAHTVDHPILSKLDPEAQEAEIRGSRDRLAEELGTPPRTFAIPNGSARDYDSHTLDILRRLGFDACCTTRRGSNSPGADPFELRRLGVGSDSIAMLEARLAGLFDEDIRRRLGLLRAAPGS